MLKKERYHGKLTVDGKSLDVRFTLSAKADCRLRFEFDAMDGPSFVLVSKTMRPAGQPNGCFAVNARNRRGDCVTSDTLSLAGYRADNDGHVIEVSYLTVTVTHIMRESAPEPILRLWFRGFSSFRNSPVETPLGTVYTWGAAKSTNEDDMTGCVAIKAPSDAPDPTWTAEADKFLRHLHQGLALAHGGRLQTPRLDRIAGNIFAATFFSGSGHRPEFPVQYFLNQDPIIAALVLRYFERGPLSDVLWVALGWMQIETTFDEVRFLTAMTALETIIESELPGRKGTVVEKTKFKALRQKLEDATDHDPNLTVDQRAIIRTRIAGINKKTFAERIDALFDHYRISRRDFSQETILSLVGLRNAIVHRGLLPDKVDIWNSIILVRELITRILLSEIGFEGRYCCYVGGLHDRNFPEGSSVESLL